MTERKRKDLTLEEAMERVEKIVKDLEGGNLPLEQSINAFSEGMKLIEYCQRKLNEIQKKVQKIINQSDESFEIEPFTMIDEEKNQ